MQFVSGRNLLLFGIGLVFVVMFFMSMPTDSSGNGKVSVPVPSSSRDTSTRSSFRTLERDSASPPPPPPAIVSMPKPISQLRDGDKLSCPNSGEEEVGLGGEKAIPSLQQSQVNWGKKVLPALICQPRSDGNGWHDPAATTGVGTVGVDENQRKEGERKDEDDWCLLEARPQQMTRCSAATDRPQCEGVAPRDGVCSSYEPLRQGNFSELSTFLKFTDHWLDYRSRSFPETIPYSVREEYFSKVPKALDPLCHICKGALAHPLLYSLRRWWRVTSWTSTGNSQHREGGGEAMTGLPLPESTSSANIFALNRDALLGHSYSLRWNEPEGDDGSPKEILEVRPKNGNGKPEGEETGAQQSANETILKLHFCAKPSPDDDDENADGLEQSNPMKQQEEGGEEYVVIDTTAKRHRLQFSHPSAGLRCFWRSVLLLLPQLAQRASRLPWPKCGQKEFRLEAQSHQTNTGSAAVAMSQPKRFPYLPCYVFRLTEKMKEAQQAGNYDPHGNFWPFACEAQRRVVLANRRKQLCERRQEGNNNNNGGASSTAGHSDSPAATGVRVAVAFSGFLRSYSHTKAAIQERLIKPHGAEVFAATWNVVGRTRKFQPIGKKETVAEHKMHALVMGLLDQANKSASRVEVLNYHWYAKQHYPLQQNGFPHTGLYFTLCRSLKLVELSGLPFDIVIRTRFDVLPTVPLVFIPVQEKRRGQHAASRNDGETAVDDHDYHRSSSTPAGLSYLLDVGSSCKMQGAWWPQNILISPGKVIKHYADTRFKLFTWQVCDWMEIGDYPTMMRIGNKLFDYIVENNVFSGAQFVEHAFHLQEGIPYQPAQLFLKILRGTKKIFG